MKGRHRLRLSPEPQHWVLSSSEKGHQAKSASLGPKQEALLALLGREVQAGPPMRESVLECWELQG